MILIATQCFAPDVGGIENLMTSLARALHRRGHEVIVCADRSRSEPTPSQGGFPWPIKRFTGPRPWRRRVKARYIKRLAAKGGVTRIICDSWKSLEPLSLPPDLPVICLVHGMEIPESPPAGKRRRIAASLARAACVVANSHYTSARVKPLLMEKARLEVIHPGVEPPPEAGELAARKAEHQLARFHPRLVSVGRLEEHKGQDQVLRCLPALLREFPNLGYVCLGEGPARPALEQRARDCNVADHFMLPGNADEATRTAYLKLSDVFVLPGRAVANRIEGFGIAFIEAAWLGLPAVAGRAGGAAEAVIHDETGLVCDGEDPDAVLAAIRKLLTDKTLRRRLGENASERARLFHWEEIVHHYEDLLRL